VFWGAFTKNEPAVFAENMRELLTMTADGTLTPRVTSSYPLEDFAAAYDQLVSRRATGKVVLHIAT
jgi:NADPH2:quinone reductase